MWSDRFVCDTMRCSRVLQRSIVEGMKSMRNHNQYFRLLQDRKELDSLRERLKDSRYRQIFHIQPYTGLLNDPNGFIRHHGVWHLFYQWCPWGAVHGLKHWYHVKSTDLVHWKEVGLAIAPDQACENEGAFSGTAITEGSNTETTISGELLSERSNSETKGLIPSLSETVENGMIRERSDKPDGSGQSRRGASGIRIFYAGNQRDTDGRLVPNVCTAKLYDDGRVEKMRHALIPPHPDYTHDQRDPQIVRTADAYYIIMGARTKADRGCLLLYSSDQLTAGWKFVGQLRVPGYENFGSMWECPSIMQLGEWDILIFCPQNLLLSGRGRTPHHNVYLLGRMDWEAGVFQPQGEYHVLDYGFDFYAAQCAAGTESGEPLILSAWMGLPDASYPTDSEDWSGCLTIPRQLTIEQGHLMQRPAAAMQDLRGNDQVLWGEEGGIQEDEQELRVREREVQDQHSEYLNQNQEQLDGKENLIKQIAVELPRSCEVLIQMEERQDRDGRIYNKKGQDCKELIRLFAKPDHTGGLCVTYDAVKRILMVDRSTLTHRFQIDQGESRAIPLRGALRSLQCYIDHSSLEIFVNDGEAVFTTRIFPTEEEGYLICSPEKMMIHTVKVWEMAPM